MNPPFSNLRFLIGFFLLSLSILLLELAQARVFSVMLWHHLSYMVISIALLGFGCAGTLVSIGWKRIAHNPHRVASFSCALFSILTALSFFTATHISLDTLKLSFANVLSIFIYYLLFFLPYLAAGSAVSVVLSAGVARVNRLYFINMVGSGVGCLFMLVLIGPLGGETTVITAALMAAISAFLFSDREMKGMRVGLLILVGGMALTMIFASEIMTIKPALSKALSTYLNSREQFPGFKTEFSQWNPISRIDVVSADATVGDTRVLRLTSKNKNLLVDGDAYTAIENHPTTDYDVDGRPAFHMYTIPYLVKKNPKVLIIGLGGGNDVFAAQLMGASEIVGCEINQITVDLIRNRYAGFVGDIYNKGNTRIYNAEGRSFIKRSKERYDLIQMTSVDTWAGLSSGAYVLSENYLYTVDAFLDYVDHLEDDGILCIIRLFFSPPREVLRLVSTAAEALRQRDVPDPRAHIIVISIIGDGLAAVLVKKSPFTEQERNVFINDRYYYPEAKVVWAGEKDVAALNPMLKGNVLKDFGDRVNPFHTFLRACSRGEQQNFFNNYLFDVTPVTDNRPFFFEFYKWENFFHDIRGVGFGGWGGDTTRPVALLILGGSTLQIIFLSIIFIIGPLFFFKRRGLNIKGRKHFIVYFLCLGLGYLMLEIVFMQKFVLFLGHPIYSIAVVLSSFLIFSGLGSLTSGIFRWNKMKTVFLSVAVISLYGTVLILGLQWLLSMFLAFELPVRAMVTGLLIFPLAFFMGMPFPAGLRAASQSAPEVVPWAVGINGCASVIASIATIILAMGVGFSAVMGIGLVVYGLALICFVFMVNEDTVC